MDCDVFKRYELKYFLSKRQHDAMRALLLAHMDGDAFGDHTILSLYYDTPDYRIIRRSIEKPLFKEKLRVRSYGIPSPGGKVFVEMKNKFDGVVYKRRISMPLDETAGFLEGKEEPASQIGREISCFLDRYPGICPAMVISYEREAYFGREDEKNVRVTFDENIRYRADELDLSLDRPGIPIIAPNVFLMEIKLPGVMPLWLAHGLDRLRIYPSSFSKYGMAFQDCMAIPDDAARKEMIRCA